LPAIPPTASYSSSSPSSSIIRGGYNRPNSSRCTKWSQSHPTPRNRKGAKPEMKDVGFEVLIPVVTNSRVFSYIMPNDFQPDYTAFYTRREMKETVQGRRWLFVLLFWYSWDL
jgi:hypothetical protein